MNPNENQTESTQELSVELVAPSALESMERAQIDMQVATAKKYQRILSVVKRSMMEFATLDEDTAAACFYSVPRQGKTIQGPSVRLAEIALSCYQNVRAGARVIANDGKTVTAQGFCHDLQNNTMITVEVKRRITDKHGRTYSDDMQVVTGNAACSIALRNAAFKVVPSALIKPVYDAAKRVAIGDAKTLSSRREKCVASFAAMGVQKEKLLAKIGRRAVEDITIEDMELLIGIHTALKDGETTVDEVFAEMTMTEKVDARKTADAKTPPQEQPKPTQAAQSPQDKLAAMITDRGYAFDEFAKYASGEGLLPDVDSLPGYEAIETKIAERLIRAEKGLLKGLEEKTGRKPL